MVLIVFVWMYKLFKDLKETHTTEFHFMCFHLVASLIMLSAFFFMLSGYLDTPLSKRHQLYLRFLPLFTVLFASFGIFLYLLPGMCDPETNTDKRIPLLILAYFIITFLFCFIINLNESVLPHMNGYIIFFPFILAFSIHLITILTEICDNVYEGVIVLALLVEAIIFAEKQNGN